MAKEKNNFKGMKAEELKKKLSELQEDLRVIHFKMEGAKSKNVKEGMALRKNIAKILTEMNKNNKKK